MSLAQPLLLVAGLLVAAGLATAAVVLARRRRAALAAVGVSSGGRQVRQTGLWLGVAGVAVLAVAAAGPTATVPTPRAAGTLVLAMDVSGSMGADDVAPTRLAAAQRAALDLIDAQPDTVDIGVVAFEQGALTTSPPGKDHATAAAAVERLKVTGGSSPGQAILASLSAITGRTVTLDEDGNPPADLGYWGSATIVLFSDGGHENESDDATRAAASAAASAGVRIDTVGVGTTDGTTVEVDGYRLHTALDEEELTTIARTTGGHYHPASDADQLDDVASGIDLRLTVADEELPLAGAFAAAALLLLSAGAAVTVWRTGRLV